MRTLLTTTLIATLSLTACKDSTREARMTKAEATTTVGWSVDSAVLDATLAAQPDDIKARYDARNPAETLTYFGIAPGMTVVDVLPGAEGKGWYTGILSQYLGSSDTPAKIVGVDYSLAMWPEFGGFADAEFLEEKKSWAADWVAGAEARKAAGEFGEANVTYAATTLGGDNRAFSESADAALFMRAMHNLNRFEATGGYRTEALEDVYAMLKPGGIVGVVQHRAPADADEGWAVGSNGYVKQQTVIDAFTAAGFEFVGSSEINANPLDKPNGSADSEDMVWRLPPTLGTSRDNDELKAQMEAIGESDRMTLKFKKPG
jgi:predicted methyltransferase